MFIPPDELRMAFAQGRLTLYLGAGLSLASGLPSWNTLVATLYYSATHADWAGAWQPYPNYLFALGEWLLRQSGEPPEVIAGKVESYYGRDCGNPNEAIFEQEFLNILYSPWMLNGAISIPSADALRAGNPLLDAAARLCEATTPQKGLAAVVTTNYDCLLEKALADGTADNLFVPTWKSLPLTVSGGVQKKIFHVHGYLPPPGEPSASPFHEIMLTEAHYHSAASDVYSWSNLSLVRCFSSSVGLIVGMSMTDRNLRRLLHALKQTNLLEPVYLVLRVPQLPAMSACDTEAIHANAKRYAARFANSGVSRSTEVSGKLDEMLQELVNQEKTIVVKSLRSFGVEVIWVDDYASVPSILTSLLPTLPTSP